MLSHLRELDWGKALDKLAEQDFVVLDHFLEPDVCSQLRQIICNYLEEDIFQQAAIGTGVDQQVNQEIHTDQIHWIDRSDPNPCVHVFLDEIKTLMHRLNRELFISLSGYEFHFAHYPPGSFYKRHLDQFEHRSNRMISVICYLNSGWEVGDGGELKVYRSEGETTIAPLEGRLVLMRSDILEHEVLTTVRDRYSITGWMCRRPPGLGFLDLG